MEEKWVTLRQGGDVYTRYKVSNTSRIWDLKNDAEVSQNLTGKPAYYYVNLTRDDGKRVGRRVHNIVGWSFLGDPPSPKHTVDHIDRDKYNNHLNNLRWADKRTQMLNRDMSVVCSDGELLSNKIKKYIEDNNLPVESTISSMNSLYRKYKDFGLCINYHKYYSKYGLGWGYEVKTLSGNTYKLVELCELLGEDFLSVKEKLFQYKLPIGEILKGYIYSKPLYKGEGIIRENTWYPSLRQLVEDRGNCTYTTFRDRLKEGMPIDKALVYDSLLERCGIKYNGVLDTLEGHCKTLFISSQRVKALMERRNLTFEEAVLVPKERVIKHAINGEVKRNTHWYEHFNINDGIKANTKLRTLKGNFRELLEHYGIDTSDMKIYPCDGDIIQYNNPY